MCPEPQLLSIYMDGELPSPWKEKMENHLTECSICREKFENYKRVQELFKKNTHQVRTVVERTEAAPVLTEQELLETAKEKVWANLASKRHFRSGRARYNGLWKQKLSIPLPAAAAAAIVITLLAALWVRDSSVNGNGYAGYQLESVERAGFILAAEEEMPGIIPAANINDVLQYLGADRPDIIILQLPESRNFFRAGEPAIIRAADYSWSHP
jgi:anti-sigma factor RsiW